MKHDNKGFHCLSATMVCSYSERVTMDQCQRQKVYKEHILSRIKTWPRTSA